MRLILVTGTPRSGSTAVGRYLSLGRGVRPLHEPFNLYAGMFQINQYFEIPGTQSFSLETMDHCIDNLRTLNLHLKPGVFPKNKGCFRLLKSIIGGRSKLYYRLCKLDPYLHTIIWKDPLACFTADYVAQYHGVDVIVPYRNPWAVAASFKRLSWSFDLDNLQGRLAEVGLYSNRSYLPHLTTVSSLHPSVLNGGLLWHIIHSVLRDWKQKNPNIKFVNLDKIIESPTQTYELLYQILGLPYDVSTELKLKRDYARPGLRSQPHPNLAHDWQRKVQDINQYWQDYLTQPEIEYIQSLNEDLWQTLHRECITNLRG